MTNHQSNQPGCFKERHFSYRGPLFASRENFEWGYFTEEKKLVEKFLTKPSDVLIIGSGNGREARPICKEGHKIICIDIIESFLESGRKLFASEGINTVKFIKADMNDLPFENESFDFVFFSMYTPAGKNRFKILKDLHNILRSEGKILLISCNPYYENLYKTKYKDAIFIDNVQQLQKEVSQCGFELIESEIDAKRQEYRFSMLKKK